MSISQMRRAMIEPLNIKAPQSKFLTSFFRDPDSNVKKAPFISLDIKRQNRSVAVDIKAGTGGRYNKRALWTNKEFMPPAYFEKFTLSGADLSYRKFGLDPFSSSNVSYQAQAIEIMMDDQEVLMGLINNAKEKQSRDAFFNGKITLVDGTEIDFNKKATHDITPSTKWDAVGGDPVVDFTTACQLIRTDGGLATTEFDFVTTGAILNVILDNDKIKDRLNFRRAELASITMPKGVNHAGATLHGTISAGENIIYLWTYNMQYEIPEGFGFADEGTVVSYMPDEKGLLIARNARYDLIHAGIPEINLDATGNIKADVQNMRMVPHLYYDGQTKTVEYGVQSKPLSVPTEIDSFVTFSSVLT